MEKGEEISDGEKSSHAEELMEDSTDSAFTGTSLERGEGDSTEDTMETDTSLERGVNPLEGSTTCTGISDENSSDSEETLQSIKKLSTIMEVEETEENSGGEKQMDKYASEENILESIEIQMTEEEEAKRIMELEKGWQTPPEPELQGCMTEEEQEMAEINKIIAESIANDANIKGEPIETNTESQGEQKPEMGLEPQEEAVLKERPEKRPWECLGEGSQHKYRGDKSDDEDVMSTSGECGTPRRREGDGPESNLSAEAYKLHPVNHLLAGMGVPKQLNTEQCEIKAVKPKQSAFKSLKKKLGSRLPKGPAPPTAIDLDGEVSDTTESSSCEKQKKVARKSDRIEDKLDRSVVVFLKKGMDIRDHQGVILVDFPASVSSPVRGLRAKIVEENPGLEQAIFMSTRRGQAYGKWGIMKTRPKTEDERESSLIYYVVTRNKWGEPSHELAHSKALREIATDMKLRGVKLVGTLAPPTPGMTLRQKAQFYSIPFEDSGVKLQIYPSWV
jgi:hypothetical protein